MKKLHFFLGVAIMAAVLTTSCSGNPPKYKEVTGITLNKSTLSLLLGQWETLIATVSPADATDKTIIWTSTNPAVATVIDGIVTAYTAGTTTIIAKAGNYTATCEVTADVGGLALDKSSLALVKSESYTLTATVLPADAIIIWTSSNPVVATVIDGIVTANTEGNATITAKAGSKTATCEVSVKDGVKINGIIWAKCNVNNFRTFSSSPTDYGKYYQWNRPTHWTAGYVSGWDSSTPTGTTWTTANDPCPDGWRVPTRNEFDALISTGGTYTYMSGEYGMRYGSGTNTLFFPAAGYLYYPNGQWYDDLGDGNYNGCFYWSSTQSNATYAVVMVYESQYPNNTYSAEKAYGFSVRCVAK